MKKIIAIYYTLGESLDGPFYGQSSYNSEFISMFRTPERAGAQRLVINNGNRYQVFKLIYFENRKRSILEIDQSGFESPKDRIEFFKKLDAGDDRYIRC